MIDSDYLNLLDAQYETAAGGHPIDQARILAAQRAGTRDMTATELVTKEGQPIGYVATGPTGGVGYADIYEVSP